MTYLLPYMTSSRHHKKHPQTNMVSANKIATLTDSYNQTETLTYQGNNSLELTSNKHKLNTHLIHNRITKGLYAKD